MICFIGLLHSPSRPGYPPGTVIQIGADQIGWLSACVTFTK